MHCLILFASNGQVVKITDHLFAGIGRIVIAGLQNPDCIPFWWIAPGFEIHSKKQDLIADWIASYFQFLQSNPDCNPFLGQLVMSDIFPILIGLE